MTNRTDLRIKAAKERKRILEELGETVDPRTRRLASRTPGKPEKTKLWAPSGRGDVELQIFWGNNHSGAFPLTRDEALHLYHQLGDWLMSHPKPRDN